MKNKRVHIPHLHTLWSLIRYQIDPFLFFYVQRETTKRGDRRLVPVTQEDGKGTGDGLSLRERKRDGPETEVNRSVMSFRLLTTRVTSTVLVVREVHRALVALSDDAVLLVILHVVVEIGILLILANRAEGISETHEVHTEVDFLHTTLSTTSL